MARKLVPLSVSDIVLQADAEVIAQALDTRRQIDERLIQREEAYKQIIALEEQIEGLIGEDGVFPYPPPPEPVAGMAKLLPASRPAAAKVKSVPMPKTQETPAAKPTAGKAPQEDASDKSDSSDKIDS